ncbi:ankyrin repeat and SOCS box protein 3-like isoform X1 [Oppia nitens]|uniref:ankyrin repeat and SOCS box protein 3-like isoform X1 n=1 Tax=Oppia nitens TaxID=1686743 RepID=UPI0023DB8F2A|nr:ankyrin repeat and SOCS box protein 3-like isoform X1 [Oppia nitens]
MDFKEHYTDSSSSVANAVRIQDLKLLRKLIRDGKCVDVMDNRGWRPLHQAVICKNVNSHWSMNCSNTKTQIPIGGHTKARQRYCWPVVTTSVRKDSKSSKHCFEA